MIMQNKMMTNKANKVEVTNILKARTPAQAQINQPQVVNLLDEDQFENSL